MVKLLRLAGMIATVLAVATVAALFQPEGASDLGGRQWNLTELANASLCEQGTPIPPGPESLAVMRRIDKKQRVVNELLDGRHTFFETATIFRRLNAEHPKLPTYPDIPGDSDDERTCWQLILWVRRVLLLRGDPEERVQEISARFERELSDHKQRYGTVGLPDVLETE
jgi:hypothetical protein